MSDEYIDTTHAGDPTAAPAAPSAPEPEAPADDPEVLAQGDDEPAGEEPVDEKPPEPAIPKGVQRRIDRAVRQKYEAEARSKMLEEQLARIEARMAPQQQVAEPRAPQVPTIDNFTNIDDYVAAKAQYVADQRINGILQEQYQRQQAEAAAHQQAQVEASWKQQVRQTAAELPDFEDVLGASEVPMTNTMQQAIMDSDVGAKLAYHLALHPAEAVKISQMTPMSQVRALGRIEATLAKTVGKPSSSAPPPIKTAGGRSSGGKDPDSMSAEEWLVWRNKQLAAKSA